MPTEAPSISGPKPATFWILIFCSYLVGSLGIISGIAQLTDLYAMPATPAQFKAKLIPAAGIIVILGAAFALVLHMTIHYRMRYRLHRDRGLVRDLYPDRNHLIGHYKDVLRDSTVVFRAAGISLHTLMNDAGFEEELKRSLASKPNLHISLVFMKPYCVFVDLKEKMEKRSAGRISVDVSSNFKRALDLKSTLGNVGDRLHLYQVDAIPAGFILQRDREIYFEPYLDNQIGRTCPTIVIQENESNQEAFAKFERNIDDLVHRSSESHFPTAEIGILITPFGQSDERKAIRQAVFFDRDGTLIHDSGYLSDPSKIHVFESACKTVSRLSKNFRVIIVTNQSGIARGYFTESDLRQIHQRLVAFFDDNDASIDAIYYCPHHPTEGTPPYQKICDCRKPNAGLIKAASAQFGIDCVKSYMVGDSESDVEAGNVAGTTSILIEHEASKNTQATKAKFTISRLSELIGIIEEKRTS